MAKSSRRLDYVLLATLTALVAPLTVWSQAINVSLSPSNATVTVGRTFQFTTKVTPTKSGVTWDINGIEGGNATLGTISSSGLYTAPAVVPSPASVTVSVISTVDSSVSANATVTVVPPPIMVTVLPSSASVQLLQTKQFSATVSGTSNTGVTWTVNGIAGGHSNVRTITAHGLYTAPGVVPSGSIVIVPPSTSPTAGVIIAAISVADTTKSAKVAVALTPLPSVSLSPSSASVLVSSTQQFVATVSGMSNTAVTWSVNGMAGGNSAVGAISAGGLYTAPSSAPSGSITVAATSVADPATFAQATVA